MPSEITLNTIENRSPFHKRLAENVIKYISCGRLLLKWQQKKVQKCETLSGCMCFFDEGGLKLRINIQGTWRVKMMVILQTNVIVSNFFAQDAPQFRWDSIPTPPLPFQFLFIIVKNDCPFVTSFRIELGLCIHSRSWVQPLSELPETNWTTLRTIWVQIPSCRNHPRPSLNDREPRLLSRKKSMGLLLPVSFERKTGCLSFPLLNFCQKHR